MWLFTRHGFFSAVKNTRDGGGVLIRARQREHLVDLKKRFKIAAEIIETRNADYRYRIVVSKQLFVCLAGDLAEEVEYPNFKSEVAARKGYCEYEAALHEVWATMRKLQEVRHG